jgi:leader peptidase (prepilin peptidase)/N-methyltransferase
MEFLLVLFVGIVGLLIGSFLNVVAHRLPVGASVVRPPSACPGCGHEIRPRDNVPVVSWLMLRGRCRDCEEPIGIRYPLVELTTGVLFAGTAAKFGLSAELPGYLFFAAISVALAVIDLDTRRLPDKIVLPSYPIALASGLLTAINGGWSPFVHAMIGGLALWALYAAIWFITGGAGMGYGDVKLSGLVGGYTAFLGWGTLVVAGFGAFLLGGIVGLGLMLANKAQRRSAIPFGPFMLSAAWIAIFAGEAISGGYLGLFGLS